MPSSTNRRRHYAAPPPPRHFKFCMNFKFWLKMKKPAEAVAAVGLAIRTYRQVAEAQRA
jgi:hypothetical protein